MMPTGRRLAAGAALLGVALAVLWWAVGPPPATQAGGQLPAQLPDHGEPAARAVQSASSAPATAASAIHGAAWRDPLAGQSDLKRAFERWADSGNASERAAAWRAWSACMPAFLGSSERAVSLEQLGAAFAPGPEREQRLEALRELYARCQGFLSGAHDALADEAQRIGRLHAGGRLRLRAETARELLAVGDRAGAIQSIGDAIAARDPAEIHELAGMVERLQADRGGAMPAHRVRDAALSMVACDLGLDCSAGSTLALQLCAMHAHCDGDVAERMLATTPDLDRASVDAERRRLATLLRTGQFDVHDYFGSP